MNESARDAVVIGAGAAGLAAALALRKAGCDVLVLEARDAPGGVMQTEMRDGFRFERGPNSFRVGAPLLALLRGAGVEAVIEPAGRASRARYLLRPSGLVAVPLGPLAAAATPLVSARGKLRILGEPFVARANGASESVAEFVTRRLGREALDALIAPFLTGVYAGDETQLGAEAVFGSLVHFERERGSIVAGALASAFSRAFAPAPRGLPGSFSAHGGTGALAAALAHALGSGALRCGARALAIARDGAGWRIALGAEEILARALVLAVDAHAASNLLAPLDAEAARLAASVAYAPIASVSLGVASGTTRTRIAGFGFLVPRDLRLDLLGALYMSQLFARRAPPGHELVTALIGGSRWPGAVDASDAEIEKRVLAGLDRALGLGAPPRVLAISRFERAVPQPGVDHAARIAALRARFASDRTLAFAGAWLDGVALGDAFASGLAAGARASVMRWEIERQSAG